MENNAIVATPAVVKVARTRLPMPPQNLGVRRFCMPTKNEAVSVASLARLASLAPRCRVGSKKVAQLPPLCTNLGRPQPSRSRFYAAGTGRIVVVCIQKSTRLLDLDCLVPQDAAGGCLRDG